MNNKLLKVIGGSALTAMLLAGCGANDNDPPPNDGAGTDDGTTEINDLNRNDRDNRIFNNNRNTGDNDLFDNDRDDDNELFDDNNNRNNDRNTDNDFDMGRDRNTPGEDGLEDRLDLNDNDNRDR
jgi:hypothetical protein